MSTLPRYPEHHPNHPRQLLRAFPGPGLFITGISTHVGKTTVTAALAGVFRSMGSRVGVCKPVATGCPLYPERQGTGNSYTDDDYDCPDATVAARQAGLDPYDLSLMRYLAPVRFGAPASPHIAARLEQRGTDWQRVASALDWWQENCDVLLIEGTGGWLVPLDSHDFMVADLAAVLRMPVLVVTTPAVGTLNHTMLTVHAIRERGLAVAGLVVDQVSMGEDVIESINLEELPRLTGVPIRAILPLSAEAAPGRIPEAFTQALLPFAREWRALNPAR